MCNYSVLMTMYKMDNPVYAKLAIDSMLNQTIRTNDYVIVCDGPLTRELDNLLRNFQEENSCLNIVKLPENAGLGAALRYGVGLCKNSFIARMDDDDIAIKNRCELELEEFKSDKKLSICGSYMYEFEDDYKKPVRIKTVPTTSKDILKFSRRRNPFNHSTVMFKKEDIISVGNYSPMRTNQDVDLWVRALNKGLKGMNIEIPLVNFRFNRNTYQRRKEWKNIKLMINIWREFKKKKYCSELDYLYVVMIQMATFFLPCKALKWAYDKLR